MIQIVRQNRAFIGPAAYIALLGLAIPAAAGTPCCDRCGRVEATQTVCRPVYTTKMVEYICWDTICEPFCPPPKTESFTCSSAESCTDADSGRLAAPWFSQPCRYRYRNKLMRKTLTKFVPVVECVVEDLCSGCHALLPPAPTPIGQPASDGDVDEPWDVDEWISDQLETGAEGSLSPSQPEGGRRSGGLFETIRERLF